ncbi:MAG: hypothetical protein ACXVB0_15625 [Mucilaginibacter sp.]
MKTKEIEPQKGRLVNKPPIDHSKPAILHTDYPLSEKDEVKKAELKLQKNSK